MLLGDFPIKREGSQGQNKTYLVALKLAQFSIQFIEDIIQQKQRYCGAGPFQEIKLCQFQGNKIGFV